jgi:tetratricopeptide (TPR) repeat protein
LQIKSDDEKIWSNRGIALYKLGRYDEAIDSYNKALQIYPMFETFQNLNYLANQLI